jgi:NAD(P)-dependent dehydrogenase (short-subunit alcohol dehydrogenase family)
MGLLDGAKAIVTGGAAGIGRATAARIVEEGGAVAILDRNAEAAADTARSLGAAAFPVDVSDPAHCTEAIGAASEALGGLTVLVNNAGVGAAMPLHDYPDSEWRKLVGVNLSGTFHCTRASVPLMRATGGAIVNVASVSGVRPTRFEAPYSAAKAGVISLTMSAALEYAPEIRVNCVSPGMVDTALTEIALGDPKIRSVVEDATPLRRIGNVEEIAGVIAFLASPLASYVTGQNLIVDGGSCLPNSQADALLQAFVGSQSRS